MEKIEVQASTHRYEIIIGEDIRYQLDGLLPKSYSSIFIITDETIAKLYLEDLTEQLDGEKVFTSIVPSGEKTKSIEYYYRLQTEAIQYGLDRKSLIIALGGGVIGDLAGFVAATLYRGVDYIQMPTTILAHDSSVGGKVAINHELGKNLIGSFYAPQAVIYDLATLFSLSDHEVRSGYAELVKEALIDNEQYFEDVLRTNLKNVTLDELRRHIKNGIEVKAKIVEADEKEANIRMFLNFGHTLAHALEAELGYGEITHGEAVAIGMLFAMQMSEQQLDAQLPIESLTEWLKNNEYPLQLANLEIDHIINHMKRDKKTIKDSIQMVLLKEIGHPVVQEIDEDVLRKQLKDFMDKMVSL